MKYSIIKAIKNKNRNALINITESIYSSNGYIRKVLLDLRMQDVNKLLELIKSMKNEFL